MGFSMVLRCGSELLRRSNDHRFLATTATFLFQAAVGRVCNVKTWGEGLSMAKNAIMVGLGAVRILWGSM